MSDTAITDDRAARPCMRWTSTTSSPGSMSTPSGGWGPTRWTAAARRTATTSSRSPTRPWWRLLAEQFADPLVLILLVAAVVAGLVGDVKDPIVIGVVLLLNAGIGFYQEQQAQSSMSALRSMLSFGARVRRAGVEVDVDGAELVPGDVVLLGSGDRASPPTGA